MNEGELEVLTYSPLSNPLTFITLSSYNKYAFIPQIPLAMPTR